ncbi:TetR family transcriptional regulator [Pseudonocardia hierapolitana]|uniref:TetR family transcriptional regulator n=1 Tax=Pseudonocardia hierapolitana TaxID=1128676 RepID=A0A561T5A6_9PSEU|nr:TetR family transcriptional regulator [Pseudonocardia hierapolitana]
MLAERGYENTRFADVSAASGVAISTLQNYFGSRLDMVVEAMELATIREVDALESVAAAEHDPWVRLVAMVDRSLDNPPRAQRMLVEFWRSTMRDDELRRYGIEMWERYRAPFLAAVGEGREQGAFTPTASPDDVVDLVLSALAGATVFRVLHHPAPPPGAGFRGVLLAQLRSMLGLGVAAR